MHATSHRGCCARQARPSLTHPSKGWVRLHQAARLARAQFGTSSEICLAHHHSSSSEASASAKAPAILLQRPRNAASSCASRALLPAATSILSVRPPQHWRGEASSPQLAALPALSLSSPSLLAAASLAAALPGAVEVVLTLAANRQGRGGNPGRRCCRIAHGR